MSTAAHPLPVLAPEAHAIDVPLPRKRRNRPNLAAVAVAAALACSPLAFGFYDLTVWAPLGLGAAVLLVILVIGARGRPGASVLAATSGIALLVALSFASILWAESRDSAWTSANELGVYAVVFAIGLIAIRTPLTAWSVITLLGLPALATALVLSAEFIFGRGGGAFVNGRLTAPMGYANGTAALLVMGSWPWIGLAERLGSRWARAAAIGAAALTAGVAVMTQTRAIVPAAAASVVLALLGGPRRARRGANLLIVLTAVGCSAPWTLGVYSSLAPTHLGAPGSSSLRAAALAVLGAVGLAFAAGVLLDRAWSRVPPRRRWHNRRLLALTMLATLAVAIAAGVAVERRSIVTQWHAFTTLNDERSANNRFLAPGGGPRYDLWRIALNEYAGDPLGGVGAGNYADQEFVRRRGLEHVTTPHSLELQMLAELGVGGAIGLLLFVVPVLTAGFTRVPQRLAGHDAALRTAALGIFAAWFAGTSVDWLYNLPGLTGMAMLAAALLLAPAPGSLVAAAPRAPRARRLRSQQGSWLRALRAPRPRPRIAAALALGVLALLAASLGRQYVATLYGESGQALAGRSPLRALDELRTAEQLDPWSLQTEYAVASAYARLNDYPDARAALRRAAQLEPENYVPPALLGDIARRAGYRRLALVEYRLALRLDPLEPSLRRAVRAVERPARS